MGPVQSTFQLGTAAFTARLMFGYCIIFRKKDFDQLHRYLRQKRKARAKTLIFTLYSWKKSSKWQIHTQICGKFQLKLGF